MSEIDNIPDMTALRVAIDKLDSELISLFARRSALIDRAARIKSEQKLPARIDSRVEEVVANARRNAAANGLDPDFFGSVWRELVELAIAQEDRHLNGDHQ